MERLMEGWMDGKIGGRKDGWGMDGWKDRWKEGWMEDGWMDGWVEDRLVKVVQNGPVVSNHLRNKIAYACLHFC
jgi:glycogen debranching enzyme